MRPEHWLYTIPLRLRSLFRWAQADQEVDDELRDHLERKTEEYVAQGMTQEEAHRRARLDLGGIEQTKEKCRDARRVNWVQDFVQDLCYGLRMLRKSPGFTAVVILTLALGIGANTAIFSVVYAVLLRPLPYPHSDCIARIGLQATEGLIPDVTVPQFEFLRDHTGFAFDSVAAFQGWSTLELKQQDRIDWLKGLRVSSDFFRTLGVSPVLGREFTRAETQHGSPLSIILGDAVWRNVLSARLDIIGTQLKLNDKAYTVVGVLPRDFGFLESPVGAYIPLQPSDTMGDQGFNTSIIARLKPNVNLSSARTHMAVLFPELPNKQNNLVGVAVVNYQHLLTGDIRPSLLVLFGAVGLLLLIACVNVVSLMLAHTHMRTREISIRLALGAGRGRLVCQLLAESLLLSLVGTCAGLFLAFWSLNTLVSVVPWDLHAPPNSIRLDVMVLAYTLGISILTSIVFGLASFWQTTRVNLGLFQKDVSVLWDLGPHDVSILMYWLDEVPTIVSARGRSFHGDTLEDVAFLTLEFPSGILAQLQISWLAPSKLRRTTVIGRQRMVVYDDLEAVEKVKIYDRGVDRQPALFGEFQMTYRSGDILSPRLDTTEPLRIECQQFLDSIRSGTEPDTGARSGVDIVRVIQAAERSMHLGGAPQPVFSASTLPDQVRSSA